MEVHYLFRPVSCFTIKPQSPSSRKRYYYHFVMQRLRYVFVNSFDLNFSYNAYL